MITPKSDWLIDKLVYFKNLWQKKNHEKNDFTREKRFFTREKRFFTREILGHDFYIFYSYQASPSEVFQSLIAVLRVLFCISEVCHQLRRLLTKTRTTAMSLRTGTRASKTQDGEGSLNTRAKYNPKLRERINSMVDFDDENYLSSLNLKFF